ncbi:MAG TPA: hypothetical protein VL595_04735 [Pseudonocardia sp.]|nr:hypothetical protein [Pseudonocardia sp.]
MITHLLPRAGATIQGASAAVLAEFAEVERELRRVGVEVPPVSPTDTVTTRFWTLMLRAPAYDRACLARKRAC